MKKIFLSITILLAFGQVNAQQMEVLYTLNYEASEIIPSNGYHACIAENEITNNGIFDIYDQNGNFISSKDFLKRKLFGHTIY